MIHTFMAGSCIPEGTMPVETPCHSSKASILSKERTPKQHMLQQSSASRSEREANDKGDNRMDSGEMFSPRSAAAMALSSISQQNQIPGQAQMKESNAQKQASPDLTKHAGATAEHYIADGVLPPPLPPQPSQAPEPRKKKNLKESFAAEQFDLSSLRIPVPRWLPCAKGLGMILAAAKDFSSVTIETIPSAAVSSSRALPKFC